MDTESPTISHVGHSLKHGPAALGWSRFPAAVRLGAVTGLGRVPVGAVFGPRSDRCSGGAVSLRRGPSRTPGTALSRWSGSGGRRPRAHWRYCAAPLAHLPISRSVEPAPLKDGILCCQGIYLFGRNPPGLGHLGYVEPSQATLHFRPARHPAPPESLDYGLTRSSRNARARPEPGLFIREIHQSVEPGFRLRVEHSQVSGSVTLPGP